LFTYIVGLFIIGLSFALEPALEWLHQRWDYKTYAQLEWSTNATLQIHRLIHDETYEEAPIWSHCANAIPTTDPEANLAGLDVSDRSHPILNLKPTSAHDPVIECSKRVLDTQSSEAATHTILVDIEHEEHEEQLTLGGHISPRTSVSSLSRPSLEIPRFTATISR